jgi:hypothetical protein
MARMKVCPACGHRNRPIELECKGCGVQVGDVDPTDEAEASGLKEDIGSEPIRPPDRTMREGAWSTACATLEFPWGEVAVRDRLNVGRDPEFSPLAHRLADNDYVSGRHAEVFFHDALLYVRDVGTHGKGSSNGTFVNGKRITADTPALLADGDEVSFSHHLTAIVRLG